MKILILAFVLLIFVVNGLEAQSPTTQTQMNVPAPTPYSIVNQDANTRVWQRQEYEAGPNGQIVTNTHSYYELATGLNYLDSSGNWQPSMEQIDVLPDGTASATQGQQKIHFPIDISNGQIEMVTPDGEHVFSQPEELSYYDGTNTVVLGELTNSIGVLVANNQVVYPNAFCGLKADLRYTFTKAGIEQDVIIKRQPLTPESYGLNPQAARLQVVTEFFNSPETTIANTLLPQQAGIALVDQSISFGNMQMVPGRAFLMGQSAADPGALVAKSWLTIDGRQFLIEEVPVDAIVEGLAVLPLTAMNESSGKAAHLASGRIVLPRHKQEKKSASAKVITKSPLPATGFVMDYLTVNSSLTNYTFQGDTTYFLSGPVILYGSSTFDGSTVIKNATNASISFGMGGGASINWNSSAYCPIIFSAKDDNSVGEAVTGSSGSPIGYYGSPVINLSGLGGPITLSNARFLWAATAVLNSFSTVYLYNCQFVNSQYGLNSYYGKFYLRNTLFANVLTNMSVGACPVDAQNTTFAGSSCVAYMANSSGGMAITNCIFSNIGAFLVNSNGLSVSGDYNGFFNCGEFGFHAKTNSINPFQTVGAGAYYLTSGCNFHNAGTTNLDPNLLNSLSQKTTYPPLVYSNVVITAPTNLSPYAVRDNTGNPDLGYAYNVLDYVFGGCDLYTNLTFSAGTVVGWFMNYGTASPSGQPYAISLNKGANLTVSGTATSPCWITCFQTTQEGNGSWLGSGYMGSLIPCSGGAGATPTINATFTKWTTVENHGNYYRDNYQPGIGTFVNNEFYPGSIYAYKSTGLYFTNCLIYRNQLYFYDQNAAINFALVNCTLYNGILVPVRTSGQNTCYWTVQNTSFDGTAFHFNDYLNGNINYTTFNHNAYNTNNLAGLSYPFPYGATTNVLETVGATDKMISGFNWQPSWFGDFYLPPNSAVIESGNTTADQLGLFHFTTQTNQVPETNAIVDIGYHYVATDTNGIPLDSNGDGIADYLEDANGDGIFDAGDLGDWQISPYGLNGGNGLQVFTPLK